MPSTPLKEFSSVSYHPPISKIWIVLPKKIEFLQIRLNYRKNKTEVLHLYKSLSFIGNKSYIKNFVLNASFKSLYSVLYFEMFLLFFSISKPLLLFCYIQCWFISCFSFYPVWTVSKSEVFRITSPVKDVGIILCVSDWGVLKIKDLILSSNSAA